MLGSHLGRRAVSFASKGTVKRELESLATADQIHVLDSVVARDNPGKLKQALMNKAPREMDLGIRKLQRQGEPVTVDALCRELKTTPGFLGMCEKVGLDLAWFEDLARRRMEVHGL